MLKVVDHYFIFNGKNSLDFGAIIDGNKTFGSAQRDYDSYQVPGRNGNLTVDNGRFNEVALPYEGFIVKDFDDNSEALRNFLQQDVGYHRLEDSIHPDEYRIAMYPGPFDPKVIFLESGSFTLTFRARPERFLKSGEIPVQVPAGETVTLLNPSPQIAKPLIYIPSGTGAVNIGDTILTITTNTAGMYIDCEIQDAYMNSTNLNRYVQRATGDFPELRSGQTTISGDMAFEITPRWWKL